MSFVATIGELFRFNLQSFVDRALGPRVIAVMTVTARFSASRSVAPQIRRRSRGADRLSVGPVRAHASRACDEAKAHAEVMSAATSTHKHRLARGGRDGTCLSRSERINNDAPATHT